MAKITKAERQTRLSAKMMAQGFGQELKAEEESKVTVESAIGAETRKAIEELLGEADVEELEEIAEEGPKDVHVAVSKEIAKEKKERKPRKVAAPKEYVPKEISSGTNCHICGKALTDPKSVVRNIGPVCAAAMKRTLKFNDETFAQFVKDADDEAWTAEIAKVRALLNARGELQTVPDGYVPSIAVTNYLKGFKPLVWDWKKSYGGNRDANEPWSDQTHQVMVGRRRYVSKGALEAFLDLYEERNAKNTRGMEQISNVRAALRTGHGPDYKKAAKGTKEDND